MRLSSAASLNPDRLAASSSRLQRATPSGNPPRVSSKAFWASSRPMRLSSIM
ncbi:hypothetical protein D3C71_2199610 [compost metagenome]